MSKFLISVFCLFFFCGPFVFAQQPAVTPDSVVQQPRYFYRMDSASIARRDSVRAVRDSLQRVSDSLAVRFTRSPDPTRANMFIDSLVRVNTLHDFDFEALAKKFPPLQSRFGKGKLRPKGETWLPAFIFLLLVFFAILRRFYGKDLLLIVQSFVSNRVLSQVTRETRLFSSWPAILLFILFGFTIGTLLYLSGNYFQLAYTYSGFRWLCVLSVSVILLFAVKILLVRVVGFLFDASKLSSEYVTIIFLSYFNAAILFLPLIVAFSLTPPRYAAVYIYIAFALLAIVFFFQFIRAGVNVLTNNRFPKMYLIIYLCALEVCPILILIKALRF